MSMVPVAFVNRVTTIAFYRDFIIRPQAACTLHGLEIMYFIKPANYL